MYICVYISSPPLLLSSSLFSPLLSKTSFELMYISSCSSLLPIIAMQLTVVLRRPFSNEVVSSNAVQYHVVDMPPQVMRCALFCPQSKNYGALFPFSVRKQKKRVTNRKNNRKATIKQRKGGYFDKLKRETNNNQAERKDTVFDKSKRASPVVFFFFFFFCGTVKKTGTQMIGLLKKRAE